MKILLQIAIAIVSVALVLGFLGTVVYTLVAWGCLFRVARFSDAFSFDRARSREIFGSIPLPIRRLGIISFIVFAGCLPLLAILIGCLRDYFAA